jgi:hypothetical protein
MFGSRRVMCGFSERRFSFLLQQLRPACRVKEMLFPLFFSSAPREKKGFMFFEEKNPSPGKEKKFYYSSPVFFI